MNKNTIIGFILIGITLFGFTWYQSKEYEKQVAYQAQVDSIARAERAAQYIADSIAGRLPVADTLAGGARPVYEAPVAIYKDSLLEAAHSGQESIYTIANDKIEVAFTTKGAQPYSVKVQNYRTYDSTDLYLFKPGNSEMGIGIYTGENINTKDFVFQLTEKTDSSIVMRLPFRNGGYIQQKYTLRPGTFVVSNELSFIGMEGVIPRNVSYYDFDWDVTIPRMEKGYKNEVQYSKVDYYFGGDKKPEEIGRGRNADKRIENRVEWFAFQQQFFSAIMRPVNQFASGELAINFIEEDDPSHNLMDCAAKMRGDFKVSNNVVINNEFYFGPNHYKTLKSYGQKYEKIIPLGGWMVGWFTKWVIIPLFDFLHKFISNFGIIILLMTLFIKIVVLPFAYKSYSSSAKMQALKPEMDKLNAKYPKQEDALKKQQATMDLYKRAGVNPMGGCLPMLLQLPILWAMFRFFPASIELRQQPFLWADDLSAYDTIPLLDFGTRIPLLGDHISLFALLMAVSMFLYSKITTQGQMSSNDPNTASMRFMSVWMMPIMMFFICNSLSSGLTYYYLLSNLITMIETWIIKKFFVRPEDVLAKLKASEGKPQPKSKWQQRLEEAQKMQRQMMKEQEKKGRR
ncbi:MAG: membrane protein insertase YidC [Bacteroides sp.]|nr:membrane protein insertase YidC [Bacteroides sp.]MDY2973285.1 membrane protein insertase YidC [Candidatus Cryptobacteroides sp.]MED9900362.1 membrane protein insertase YidC [Bacteroidales bacterium]